MLPELGRAGCLERARRAWGGRGSARPCMRGGAQPPRILGKSGNISTNTAFPLNARARNEPREPRPDPPREPQGDPGGGAPREEGTLPLFATLPAPGHAKTRLPREPGGQLCRYLRHLPLRGHANRPSRSSGRQIRPDSRGNGTGVSAISAAEPRVFDGFRGEGAIWPESPVKRSRDARLFRPELAAPERN